MENQGRSHEIIMACLVLGIACSVMINGAECKPVGSRRSLIDEKVSNIMNNNNNNNNHNQVKEGGGNVDDGGAQVPPSTNEAVFDVMKYGAKANGRADDGTAFIKAWRAACDSEGLAKVVIPPGTYMAGEVVFSGPCKAQAPITIEIQGNLSANTDPSSYTQGAWIMVERVENVVVTGGGTINGNGKESWKYAGGDGPPLSVSIVFQTVGFCEMHDLNFVDSMGFHIKVTDSHDVALSNLKITAPGKSPNTDGIHLSNATNVNITDSVIGTGDDCISVGHGTKNILVSGIICGPGHGISVGSLGKRQEEMSVNGVTITNCTINGTTNGARIKTYHGSPKITATGIVFQDIVMSQVKNPIIIDQHYDSKKKPEQSSVKISDVRFTNIMGTTISKIPIMLNCSSTFPCENIELSNIDLTPFGSIGPLQSACSHAVTILKGTVKPAGPTKCA
ncbi:hypothetical protein BUALT_Bualt02G0237500 [Buddleja alternifolia]|uniref:Glycoside hydrolase family 28 n=1 Tax=Buddleja alternifolia TaxID=168488 RepID=A0AAV6Y2U3_9LAMI|nr:hypothetical protein BUALT_Bualt02G0237500 [Buddleja alternifolia]